MELKDYDFVKKLISGNFGSILLVRRRKDNKEFVIKKQAKDCYNYAENEATIMSKMNHPNILAFYESWEDDDKNYILTEHASEGTLYDLLNDAYHNGHTPMKEDVALGFFSQLLLGLAHMHDRNIIHRDLKPENIMFAGPLKRVKIIDFGLSRDTSEELNVQTLNPNTYTAPENWSEDKPYTFQSDVWSIGILLYEVITGTESEHLEDNLEVLEDLPLSAKTICINLLKVVPNERPECCEVIRYPELTVAMCNYYQSLELAEQEIVYEQLHDIVDDINAIN